MTTRTQAGALMSLKAEVGTSCSNLCFTLDQGKERMLNVAPVASRMYSTSNTYASPERQVTVHFSTQTPLASGSCNTSMVESGPRGWSQPCPTAAAATACQVSLRRMSFPNPPIGASPGLELGDRVM